MRSKLTLAFACACALVVALAAAATLHAETTPEPPTETETETAPPPIDQWQIQRKIDKYRHETWRWQRMMGRRLTRSLKDPPAEVDAKIAVWKRVAVKTRVSAQNPPHKRQWLCIHRYEGSLDRPESAVLRRPPDGSRVPAHLRPAGCSHARGRRTTGRRSSRCGLQSGRTVPAEGSTPGRTRRATAV